MSEQVMLAAWENPEPLPAAVEEFFDGYGHDSISHWFTGDLTVWRTIHFGRQKYTPGTVDVVDTESTATPEPALN